MITFLPYFGVYKAHPHLGKTNTNRKLRSIINVRTRRASIEHLKFRVHVLFGLSLSMV